MRIRDSAIVRRAVELGAGFLDTADIYGDGDSERLIGEAFDTWPEDVSLGTKGGLNWEARAGRFRDGRPEYLRRALGASLQRLRRDHVELYTLHRHDPEVPIEESVGAIDELRFEGKCLAVGVSNVSLDQLARARSVCEITAVQNEFNRGFLVSEAVLEGCERAGIWFMPWVIVPIPGTSSLEHLEELMC
jgi:pyridoxine 4-dehydrogenase